MRCNRSVTEDGWHFHLCGRPAKWWVLQGGGKWVPRCGLHARPTPYHNNSRLPITATEEERKAVA